MSLSGEIDELFNQAQRNIRARTDPPGVMPREGGPDLRFVIVNENFAAFREALRLIAERIDGDGA